MKLGEQFLIQLNRLFPKESVSSCLTTRNDAEFYICDLMLRSGIPQQLLMGIIPDYEHSIA